ncbi:class II aldolase/adducin N-terminal [Mycena galopus ATCC 62051]|nr:class II aldolase/adducin N-terminal [Mycena galopus ATCC 62051]
MGRLRFHRLAVSTAQTHTPKDQTHTGAFPNPPVFATKLEEREYLKFRLAQALRIFGKHGYDEGVAGHITAPDPIRLDCFWVNPFGLHFKLIQPHDLLFVDHTGKILEESGQKDGPFRILNTAAFMIHSAIHTARPDVLCAAHSHSPYGKAFSVLGKMLDPISQDACMFYAIPQKFNRVGVPPLSSHRNQRLWYFFGVWRRSPGYATGEYRPRVA